MRAGEAAAPQVAAGAAIRPFRGTAGPGLPGGREEVKATRVARGRGDLGTGVQPWHSRRSSCWPRSSRGVA